jgi:hypothetical protein
MFWSELLSASFAAPSIALVAVLLSMGTYALGRWTQLRTLSAKYRDRLYDLNKLTMQSGEVALAFLDPRNHTGHYFDQLDNVAATTAPPGAKNPLELVAQLRAYVHYRLNFYEEVFYATDRLTFRIFEDRAVWRS